MTEKLNLIVLMLFCITASVIFMMHEGYSFAAAVVATLAPGVFSGIAWFFHRSHSNPQ